MSHESGYRRRIGRGSMGSSRARARAKPSSRRHSLLLETMEDRTLLSQASYGLLSTFAGTTNRQIDPALPAPSLAAGPTDLIVTTNDLISIQLKDGSSPTQTAAIDNPADTTNTDFFRSIDQNSKRRGYGDPLRPVC